ncbi:MAG: cofactor-independent phosphoglycerate mutase [Planctomycetota bacterium]|nr:cofactor-independent phosphoglycerate mutase [Planctomycetota bacterium]
MKYAIIIPDGAADGPLDDLKGLTPLQAAYTPNMDAVVAEGHIGTTRNIPDSLAPGSDVAIESLLGYDPREVYTGRAPLEASARSIPVGDDDWVFRCNLVTIIEGVMEDHSAGHISTEEASALLEQLAAGLNLPEAAFYPGVGYRHLLVLRGDYKVTTTPPHQILGQKAADHLPSGRGSKVLREIIARSGQLFAGSEINTVRRELGENPATSVWLWGQGQKPQLASFASKYGLKRGAAITAVDLVRGLARLIGWDTIAVEGATAWLDTNYAGKGAAAVEAISNYDIVLVHVEAPDEASHAGNIAAKVKAIEAIDRHVVGPVLQRLKAEGEGHWRILVLPDHPTPCATRDHTRDPVPFAIAGAGVKRVVTQTAFSEPVAAASDLHIRRGSDLMEYFLSVR